MVGALMQKLFNKAVSSKHCFACTRSLDKQKKREPINTETEVVHCKCGKVYLYDRLHRQYTPYRDSRIGRGYGS
jgi:hypothetical protein